VAAAQEPALIVVDAPPPLEALAARIREIDRTRLGEALERAGLSAPPEARITLVPEDDARARAAPRWVVAQASGVREIVIFPARVGAYPHDSLDSVVRHEMVHLALTIRAAGRPLPRWFHEGVAVSVEEGGSIGGQLRLVLAALRDPGLADLNRLFAAGAQPETASAYLLAAALVGDVRHRHGATVPGDIASRVADDTPFRQAFRQATGETPEEAADRAWGPYRRWSSWIAVLTSGSGVWLGIVTLAVVAFIANLRRRARRRRRWEEEENEEDWQEQAGNEPERPGGEGSG
jgi:hypothetical protein